MPTIKRERRVGLRCPSCAKATVKREITVKGKAILKSWRCWACDTTWPEKRGNTR